MAVVPFSSEPNAIEIRVLRHSAEGMRSKQVAQVLGSTDLAVRATMKRVRAKLGARNGTHAVAIAIRRGLI